MRTKKTVAFVFLFVCLSLWNFGDSLLFQTNLSENQQTSPFSLSNGLNVVYLYNPTSEVTVMQFLIKGGKMAEPQGKDGLAMMMTRLCIEIPDRSTLQKIMTQATQINMTSNMDYSLVSIGSLSEHFDSSINLFSKILLKPLFSSIRIDSIKKAMNRSREFRQEDPLQLAHKEAMESFYGDSAYSGSFYGQEDTLKSIRKRDVDNFYEKYFTAKNTSIFVSSDLDEGTIRKILENHF